MKFNGGSPNPSRASRALVLSVALLLAALYVAPLVWPVPLMDPDEGLHAAIAQEMLSRGDFVVPRFLGEPFLDKPILFFWSLCASMWLFGQNEAAVRLPGLVFGALGAVTTAWLAVSILGASARQGSGSGGVSTPPSGRRPRRGHDTSVRRGGVSTPPDDSRRRSGAGSVAGWWAALVYTTMLVPIALMEIPVHDIALVPFVNLALLGFWRASRAQTMGRVLAWSAGAGIALGGAMLTKGLTGLAIVGLAHLALLLLERRLSIRVVAGGLLALAVGAAIALPWYLAMEHANPGYLHYYIVERHVSGFASESQRHAYRPWGYYVPILLAGGLPWTLYVPLSVRLAGGGTVTTAGLADLRRLGAAWLLTGLVFLSVAGSKLFTYALPLFPPLALLAVVGWLRALETEAGRRWLGRLVAVHAVVLCLVLPAIAAASSLDVLDEPLRVPAWIWLAALGIAAGCATAVHWWRRGRALRAGAAGAVVTAAVVFTVLLGVLPPAAHTMTAKDLAAALNRRATFPPALWIVRDRLGSVVFYLAPRLRAGLTRDRLKLVTPRDVRILRAPAGTLVAIDDDTLERMSSFVVLDGVPYERAGQYRLYDAAALGNVTK
jgi:4-amino-4-deoxy-L-arabinose transferase-like glycosyltransferase